MKNKDVEKGKKEPYTEDDMALGIRAVSDICFKYIFGTEESTDLLRAFINAVLADAGFPAVREVMVVNPFVAGVVDDMWSKVSFFDVSDPSNLVQGRIISCTQPTADML